jgi:hypothetical protein
VSAGDDDGRACDMAENGNTTTIATRKEIPFMGLIFKQDLWRAPLPPPLTFVHPFSDLSRFMAERTTGQQVPAPHGKAADHRIYAESTNLSILPLFFT